MNKQELNEALAFISAPEGELQIIIYANISGANEPRRLDIKEEDLTELRKLFVASIESSIIRKKTILCYFFPLLMNEEIVSINMI